MNELEMELGITELVLLHNHLITNQFYLTVIGTPKPQSKIGKYEKYMSNAEIVSELARTTKENPKNTDERELSKPGNNESNVPIGSTTKNGK
jgi:hypothetical protein